MNQRISRELVQSSRGVSKHCAQCAKPFDIFVREHICKRCLKAVCSACSPTKEIIQNYDMKPNEKHRICKTCAGENDFQKALIKDNSLNYGQSSAIGLRWLASLQLISDVSNREEIAEIETKYEAANSVEMIQKIDITRMKTVLSYSYRDFAYKVQSKDKSDEEVQILLVNLLNKLAAELLWRKLPNKFHAIALFFLAFTTPGQAFALLVHIYRSLLPQYIVEFINQTGSGSLGLSKSTHSQKTKIVQMVDYLVKTNGIEEIESKNFKLFLHSIGIELAATLFVDLLSFECSYEAINLMLTKNSFLEIEKLLLAISRSQHSYIKTTQSESRDAYSLILLHLIRKITFQPLGETLKEEAGYDEHVANAVNEQMLMTEIPQPSREFIEGMRKQRAMSVDGLMQHHNHFSMKNVRKLPTSIKEDDYDHDHDHEDEEDTTTPSNQAAKAEPIPHLKSENGSMVEEASTPVNDEYKQELLQKIDHHRDQHEKLEQRTQYLSKELHQKEKLNETLGNLISQKDAEINQIKQQSSECLHMHNRTALDRLWRELQILQSKNEELREQTIVNKQSYEKEKNELLVASQNLVANSKVSADAAAKISQETQQRLQDENTKLLSLLGEREASILKKDSEIALLRLQIQTATDDKERSKELQESIRNQLQSKSKLTASYQSGVNEQVAQLHKNIRDLRESHESALEMQRNLMRWDAEKHVLEIEEMTATLKQHEEIIAALRKELADLKGTSGSQANTIAEQKAAMSEAGKSREASEKMIEQLSEEIRKLNATIDEQKNQLGVDKENEYYLREDVRRLVEFVELRDLRIRDLNSVDRYNTEKINELELLCQQQRARIIEFEQITADNAALIVQLNEQIRVLTEKLEQTTSTLASTAQILATEQAKLRETSDALTETQNKLAEKTTQYNAAHQENHALKEERHQLQEVVARETQRAHAAEHLVAELREEIRVLLERSEAEKRALEEKFKEQLEEADRIKAQHEELVKKLEELQAEKDRLEHEGKHKDQTIEQLNEKIHHREKEHLRLQGTLKDRETEVDDKDKIIEDLRRQLAATQEELANTQADLNKYLSIFVSVKNTVVNVEPETPKKQNQ